MDRYMNINTYRVTEAAENIITNTNLPLTWCDTCELLMSFEEAITTHEGVVQCQDCTEKK